MITFKLQRIVNTQDRNVTDCYRENNVDAKLCFYYSKFRYDWVKIVDFLIKAYFCVSLHWPLPVCLQLKLIFPSEGSQLDSTDNIKKSDISFLSRFFLEYHFFSKIVKSSFSLNLFLE